MFVLPGGNFGKSSNARLKESHCAVAQLADQSSMNRKVSGSVAGYIDHMPWSVFGKDTDTPS